MAFDNIAATGEGPRALFQPGPRPAGSPQFQPGCQYSLKFFTTCGLQEGYEPFCVNMYRRLPLWYDRELAFFESFTSDQSPLEIVRVPASPQNPPCLKVSHRQAEMDKVPLEFIRLSLPVKCHATFTLNKKDRETRHEEWDRMADERRGSNRPDPPDIQLDPAPAGY